MQAHRSPLCHRSRRLGHLPAVTRHAQRAARVHVQAAGPDGDDAAICSTSGSSSQWQKEEEEEQQRVFAQLSRRGAVGALAAVWGATAHPAAAAKLVRHACPCHAGLGRPNHRTTPGLLPPTLPPRAMPRAPPPAHWAPRTPPQVELRDGTKVEVFEHGMSLSIVSLRSSIPSQ
jgi:hypothetical protein